MDKILLLCKSTFLVSFIFFLSSLFLSCEDSPSKPDPKKNPRDYTWKADTLEHPDANQVTMSSIWASSENDIYICGHSDITNANLWHYNGINWSNASEDYNLIQLGGHSLYGVWGSSADNIWAVGNESQRNPEDISKQISVSYIIHFNGAVWTEQFVDTNNVGRLKSIHGNSPNNVWACGYNGLILHYNGVEWIKDTVDIITIKKGDEFILSSIKIFNSKPYIMAHHIDNINIKQYSYFITGDIGNWKVIASHEWGTGAHPFGLNNIYSSPWNKLYSHAWGIFEWQGDNNWNQVFDNRYPISDMMGTDEDNVFAVGGFSRAHHWNGTDWHQIKEVYNEQENIYYQAVWCFDDQVFIIGSTLDTFPQNTVVWHGK